MMADKLAATFHPYLYPCLECHERYTTPSAAETCAEQDELEDKQTRRGMR